MDKKTVLKGMWWVKGNKNDKFIGILTYGSGDVPRLEIFPKEYDWGKQLVPNNSTIYGDVFWEPKKIQAVTLLECRSQNVTGHLDVGAYIYKHEFVYADCVAIGILLDDNEVAQVQSPQNIYLTSPGLDEYSMVSAVDYKWKDIPKDRADRAYRVSDLENIVHTPPDPIVIEFDIGTITIYLGHSSTARDVSSRYMIHISLANPTPQDKVNSLIYSQLLSFLSIMTGRRQYIESHEIEITSNQTRSGSLSIELNYGNIAHLAQQAEHDMLQALLLGTEENMRKFATLFPKWRENFAFVKDSASHYLHMVDQPTETNILRSFTYIEDYVLERLLEKNKKNMSGILNKVINSNADYFQCSNVYAQHFPTDRRNDIAGQLANFRHNSTHPKSNKECTFSLEEVYAHINVILRSIFLKEMEYSYKDIDGAIKHWKLWHQIDSEVT